MHRLWLNTTEIAALLRNFHINRSLWIEVPHLDASDAMNSSSGFESSLRGAPGAQALIEDIYTLAPLQQGMLFHILSQPDQTLYFDQTVCLLRGELHLEAFREAWRRVIQRHPALRTAFQWQGLTQAVQVVYRQLEPDLVLEDWSELPAEALGPRLDAFLMEDRLRGFDLARPPLLRLRLCRESETAHRLVWSVSHLLVDAWCSAVVLDEVVRLYEGLRQEGEVALAPAHPYRDYISWQKRQDLQGAESFWRRYLAGFRQPVAISSKGPEGLEASYRSLRVALRPDLSEALRQKCREQGLTLNTAVLGAWSLALGLFAGCQDVVLGVTLSGRSAPVVGAEGIIGPFVNTLPLRVAIHPGEPFLAWLAALQKQQVEMRQYEHSPLPKVQGWSSVPSGQALFDNIFVFLNVATLGEGPLGSLQVEDLRYLGRPHYPLTVQVTPGRELVLELAYDVSQVRQGTVETLACLVQTLLAAAAQAWDPEIAELLNLARGTLKSQRRENREKRRDSNSGRLRDTRPVPIPLPAERSEEG
jgi:hypothetical protein